MTHLDGEWRKRNLRKRNRVSRLSRNHHGTGKVEEGFSDAAHEETMVATEAVISIVARNDDEGETAIEEPQQVPAAADDDDSDSSAKHVFGASNKAEGAGIRTLVADDPVDHHDDVGDDDDSEYSEPLNKKTIRFGNIEFHEFPPAIGDSPSVSGGCPIMLRFFHDFSVTVGIEEYETNRLPRRSRRALIMSARTREDMYVQHLQNVSDIRFLVCGIISLRSKNFTPIQSDCLTTDSTKKRSLSQCESLERSATRPCERVSKGGCSTSRQNNERETRGSQTTAHPA